MGLYSRALVIYLVNNKRKLFNAEIITVNLKASLLLNALLCICKLTFITEVLHLKHMSIHHKSIPYKDLELASFPVSH